MWHVSNIMFQDGATPLFLASQEGHVTVIRQLLSSGAKVNHPREVRPLPHTIIEDLNRGTDFFISLLTLFLFVFCLHSTPLQDGTAPLWMAAQMGHSEVVKVLLLRGADRDADRKVCCPLATQSVPSGLTKTRWYSSIMWLLYLSNPLSGFTCGKYIKKYINILNQVIYLNDFLCVSFEMLMYHVSFDLIEGRVNCIIQGSFQRTQHCHWGAPEVLPFIGPSQGKIDIKIKLALWHLLTGHE